MTAAFVTVVLVVLVSPGVRSLTSDEISKFKVKTHIEQNTNQQGRVSITIDGDYLRLESNNVPDHVTGTFPDASTNPNAVKAQTVNARIPNKPQNSTPHCLPEGPIAYAINGIAIYNPYNGFGENAVEGDTAEVFDSCKGHPSPDGMYHYHQNPVCVHGNGPDELIGVARDGYPIYSSKDANGRTWTPADLDDCNGHWVDGNYRYRITSDFPYVMGCFRGAVDLNLDARQQAKCYFVRAAGHGSSGGGGGRPPPGGGPPGGGGMAVVSSKSTLLLCIIILFLILMKFY